MKQSWFKASRQFAMSATAAMTVAAFATVAPAQVLLDELPPEDQGVGTVERLGETIPLDLKFLNEQGETVELSEYFQPGKPVILTLNYYTCPMLCHLTLNGLVDGMRDLQWNIGDEFQIVTITVNPDETPAQAKAFKERYLTSYRHNSERAGAEDGWHFLSLIDEESIEKLAYATGFGYRYVPETDEYAHPSTIIFITPDGRISRYMNNVMFPARDLRLALVETSEGTVGSPMDRIALFNCFMWDPDSGTYVVSAMKVMRAGGVLTMLLLGMGLLVLWRYGGIHERGGGGGHAGGQGKVTLGALPT